MPALVNFGGDFRCSGPRRDGQAWQVGVESLVDLNLPERVGLFSGALASSGDARRYLLKGCVR